MAADFQNLHSNLCCEAKGGAFGSKFATVCVSSNDQNQVDLKGYQVLLQPEICTQCWSIFSVTGLQPVHGSIVREDCLVNDEVVHSRLHTNLI